MLPQTAAGWGRGVAPPRGRRLASLALLAAIAVIALAACQSSGHDSAAAAEASAAERLDRALERSRRRLGAPVVTAALIRDGRVVWSGAAGTLGVGAAPPAGPDTQFITASSAKTVTAAMILRLADRGRLRLGAPVARYLPGLTGARRIRVVDLLRHSSGLPDYLASRRIGRIIATRPRHRWTRSEVLRSARRLRFAPGSRFRYSNTNYVALGGIVERVGAGRVQATFERFVAEPLGLDASDWRHGSVPTVALARPYVQTRSGLRDQWPGELVPTDFWGEVWTDGGLATTAEELGVIANALLAGDLLRPRTRRRMLRIGPGGAGLGVFAESYAGRRWFGHDGLYAGFSSQHWTDRRSGETIAVMSNLETGAGRPDASWAIWKRLARAMR